MKAKLKATLYLIGFTLLLGLIMGLAVFNGWFFDWIFGESSVHPLVQIILGMGWAALVGAGGGLFIARVADLSLETGEVWGHVIAFIFSGVLCGPPAAMTMSVNTPHHDNAAIVAVWIITVFGLGLQVPSWTARILMWEWVDRWNRWYASMDA